MKISMFFGGAAYNSKADNSGAGTVYYRFHQAKFYVLKQLGFNIMAKLDCISISCSLVDFTFL